MISIQKTLFTLEIPRVLGAVCQEPALETKYISNIYFLLYYSVTLGEAIQGECLRKLFFCVISQFSEGIREEFALYSQYTVVVKDELFCFEECCDFVYTFNLFTGRKSAGPTCISSLWYSSFMQLLSLFFCFLFFF